MSFENISVSVEGALATVTIERPAQLNALNHQTVSELSRALDDVAGEDGVRCVLLTGAGEKAFVAGADIGELRAAAGDADAARELASYGQEVFAKLETIGKPSVAMINGFALGGGLELALACTLRTASTTARVGLPEVSLGIIPGYGGTQRLSRIAGPGVAREWVLTGDMYGAAEAHRVGVVNRVFEPDELLDGTLKMIRSISSRGPIAVRLGMEAISRGQDLSLDAGQALEAEMFGKASTTEDMREGMTAFLEKRPPEFTGR
ncbi:MAG: enoyl-CoA hydratase-related protein [Planctomycetota bacterium]|jgi:enoyl-CoA hydratase|nr:enoyl-CoA hydratase-related protein [Planctomycetota bacterium]MDP6763150.1 enoyl-CoA hydratase-related protein [Planctomycetota bacterium]MDP6989866.1 enoyl-CoA hydratase-related protein [Planctomycetota bacterium]